MLYCSHIPAYESEQAKNTNQGICYLSASILPSNLGLAKGQLNYKINKIHESTLIIIYKDTERKFSNLLEKYTVTIHTKSLQARVTAMSRTKNNLNPSCMHKMFR